MNSTEHYQPGDLANGHVLTAEGNWVPTTSPQTPSPQPKKPIWTRWWMIAGYVIVALSIIGGITGGGDDSSDSGKPAAAAAQEAGKPAASTGKEEATTSQDKAAAGQPAQGKPAGQMVGHWLLVGKPAVEKDALDQFSITMRVQNTSDSADEPMITATFLAKDGSILGTADMFGTTAKPDQIITIESGFADDYRANWNTIEFQDTF